MMTSLSELSAIEAIRRAKARYFRGVDRADGDLVRSILTEDCVLDYRGCCTDPATGRDFLPGMNVVLRGRENWLADGMTRVGIVSVHQGHHGDIELTGEATANAIWAMTDHLYMPPGAAFAKMTGHGFYHETYERGADEIWRIATLRIERIRVEVA